MPFLRVSEGEDAVDIYYHIYDDEQFHRKGPDGDQSDSVNSRRMPSRSPSPRNGDRGPGASSKPHVVLIMGFAAGQGAWTPQLHGLLHPAASDGGTCIRVLTMDNRGVGRSSCPRPKESYSTDIMARDVLALMDHLRWQSAHLVGHSMGGMIAMKLAALAPDRVSSLSVVSATGGGWQSLPFSWRAAKYMWRAYRAGDARERARVDLKFHFMRETLREFVLGRRRKEMLLEEYTGVPDAGTEKQPAQPKWAMKGQLHAIWHHSISAREFQKLKSAAFRKQVVHGRYDILAAPKHAAQLAQRMRCRLVLLDGAHFVTRECGTELNSLLRGIIFPPQEALLPQHYMTPDAGSSVAALRAPSADLEAVVELAGVARTVANGLAGKGVQGEAEREEGSVHDSGGSPSISGITSAGSSTGSNMHLLGRLSGSRRGKANLHVFA